MTYDILVVKVRLRQSYMMIVKRSTHSDRPRRLEKVTTSTTRRLKVGPGALRFDRDG